MIHGMINIIAYYIAHILINVTIINIDIYIIVHAVHVAHAAYTVDTTEVYIVDVADADADADANEGTVPYTEFLLLTLT